MMEVEILVELPNHHRGDIVLVGRGHPLERVLSTPYVKILRRGIGDVEKVEKPKRTRKPKEVADGTDRAESGSGPDLGADSGS